MDTNAAILALLQKMDTRLTALESTPAPQARKAKGKGKGKARKVDTRTANERQADKLMKRIRWHEDRLATLGDKARPGQIKWNRSEIDRLSREVQDLRVHAAEVGETLPDDVRAERAVRVMSAGRTLDASPDAIMRGRKGDRVEVAGDVFTCSGGGWYRDSEGEAIRRADLADLAS